MNGRYEYKVLSVISTDEFLKRYEAGQRAFEYVELIEGQSLRGAVLAGTVFRNSWASCIDFREADLREASFIDSNVKVSDFRGADLRGASFRGCVICGVLMKGAKLENVVMADTTYYGFTVEDIRDLKDTNLKSE